MIVVAFLWRFGEEQILKLHCYIERGAPYALNIELNRIPAYFQLNGNNKRKKSKAFARMLANRLIEM